VQSQNLAIMFTDIKGYTERTATQSRDKTSILLAKHYHLVVPIVAAFGGRVIKGIGDAFLVAFPSSTGAVLAGMTIQDRLYKHNAHLPENEQIHLRVAINTGEVLNIKGDVYGETVNVAARVEGITPANEVYLTEAVYLTMNKSEVNAVKVGQFELKGVPYPVNVFRVPSGFDAPTPDATVVGEGGTAAAVGPAAHDGASGSGILLLPFGGTHLSRIEQQFFTPRRKAQILGLCVTLVLGLAAVLIAPGVYRNARWNEVEALVSRGQIDAALSTMASLSSSNEAESARRYQLSTQVVDRLLERGAPEQAVEVLVKMAPANAEERAAYTKQLFLTLDSLVEKSDFESAMRLMNRVLPANASDSGRLFDMRARLARGLLARGRLDELAPQVEQLLATNPKSPTGYVIKGHMHAALSARASPYTNLSAALGAYEKALTIELSAAEDELLVKNVVAIYNNTVDDPKKRVALIEKADTLISGFVGVRAAQPLSDELSRSASGSSGRSWIVDRLRRLGADKNIDQESLLLQDLLAKPCEGRNVEASKKLLGRLRDEGGPRAVGALLRYSRQYTECSSMVGDAVERIIGERVALVPAGVQQLDERMALLRASNCKGRAETDQALKTVGVIGGAGESRAVGELLRFAAKNPSCSDSVLRVARGLSGADSLMLSCPPPPPPPACPTCPACATCPPASVVKPDAVAKPAPAKSEPKGKRGKR